MEVIPWHGFCVTATVTLGLNAGQIGGWSRWQKTVAVKAHLAFDGLTWLAVDGIVQLLYRHISCRTVQHHQYATSDKMQAPRKYRLNGVHFRKQLYLFQKNLNPPKERPTLAQARKVLRRSKSKVSNPRDRGTAHAHQRIIRRVSLAGRLAAKGQRKINVAPLTCRFP